MNNKAFHCRPCKKFSVREARLLFQQPEAAPVPDHAQEIADFHEVTKGVQDYAKELGELKDRTAHFSQAKKELLHSGAKVIEEVIQRLLQQRGAPTSVQLPNGIEETSDVVKNIASKLSDKHPDTGLHFVPTKSGVNVMTNLASVETRDDPFIQGIDQLMRVHVQNIENNGNRPEGNLGVLNFHANTFLDQRLQKAFGDQAVTLTKERKDEFATKFIEQVKSGLVGTDLTAQWNGNKVEIISTKPQRLSATSENRPTPRPRANPSSTTSEQPAPTTPKTNAEVPAPKVEQKGNESPVDSAFDTALKAVKLPASVAESMKNVFANLQPRQKEMFTNVIALLQPLDEKNRNTFIGLISLAVKGGVPEKVLAEVAKNPQLEEAYEKFKKLGPEAVTIFGQLSKELNNARAGEQSVEGSSKAEAGAKAPGATPENPNQTYGDYLASELKSSVQNVVNTFKDKKADIWTKIGALGSLASTALDTGSQYVKGIFAGTLGKKKSEVLKQGEPQASKQPDAKPNEGTKKKDAEPKKEIAIPEMLKKTEEALQKSGTKFDDVLGEQKKEIGQLSERVKSGTATKEELSTLNDKVTSLNASLDRYDQMLKKGIDAMSVYTKAHPETRGVSIIPLNATTYRWHPFGFNLYILEFKGGRWTWHEGGSKTDKDPKEKASSWVGPTNGINATLDQLEKINNTPLPQTEVAKGTPGNAQESTSEQAASNPEQQSLLGGIDLPALVKDLSPESKQKLMAAIDTLTADKEIAGSLRAMLPQLAQSDPDLKEKLPLLEMVLPIVNGKPTDPEVQKRIDLALDAPVVQKLLTSWEGLLVKGAQVAISTGAGRQTAYDQIHAKIVEKFEQEIAGTKDKLPISEQSLRNILREPPSDKPLDPKQIAKVLGVKGTIALLPVLTEIVQKNPELPTGIFNKLIT